MTEGVTIKISRELHELLKELKTGDESFDSFLSRTLKKRGKNGNTTARN